MKSDRFIYRSGQDCIVTSRDPTVSSKCFVRLATKSVAMISLRDAERELITPSDLNLDAGEILKVGTEEYLIQTTLPDQLGSRVAYGAKVNATLTHSRLVDTVDENWNPIKVWEVQNSNVKAFGQVVTTMLRQEDPGILETTTAIFYAPASYNIQTMDRLNDGSRDYQVEVVDNVFLPNISRIQVRYDERE